MPKSAWEAALQPLQALIMKPVLFNDMTIILIDAVIACHESGWEAEEHRHPWFEFNYVSRGCLHTTMEQTEFATGPGAFFLVPPGVFHSNQNKSGERDDGFCLRWLIENRMPESPGQDQEGSFKPIFKTLACKRTYSAENKMIDLLIADMVSQEGLLALQMTFARLIVALHELWNQETIKEKNKPSREEILVRQAEMYLTEYFPTRISVHDLANSLNISYRQLARVFKHVTGITIIEKLNDIRINQAKHLLSDTSKTVKEIAQSVGFENEYYFSSTFSKYAYTSPSEFRKKFRVPAAN